MNAQTEMTDEKIIALAHRHCTIYRHIEREKFGFNENGIVEFVRFRIVPLLAHLTKPDAGGGEVVSMPEPVGCGYVSKVKDATLCESPYVFTIGYDVVTVEQCKAYADARVSEATRELVVCLREAADGMGGSFGIWEPKARAILAKYPQK